MRTIVLADSRAMPGDEVARAGRQHHEGGGEIGRRHHVHEA